MHDAIQIAGALPAMRDPLALIALWGLGDGTGSAVGALRHLREKWTADEIATLDPDHFYNLTSARPRRVNQGDEYVLRWPGVRFYVAHLPSGSRDVLLISGREPHLRWGQFIDAIASFLDEAGVRDVLTLTSRPAEVPHTRPAPLTLNDVDPEFGQALHENSESSSYQGPTSMTTVLAVAFRERGLRTGRLTALVPDYVNFGPNPHAVLTLVHRVHELLEIEPGIEDGVVSMRTFNEQVEQAISGESNASEIRAHIAALEERYDREHDLSSESDSELELPSSQDLLRGIEELLRDPDDEASSPSEEPS